MDHSLGEYFLGGFAGEGCFELFEPYGIHGPAHGRCNRCHGEYVCIVHGSECASFECLSHHIGTGGEDAGLEECHGEVMIGGQGLVGGGEFLQG